MRKPFVAIVLCAVAASPVFSLAAPLAQFDAKEVLGIDWPRTLVSYEVKLNAGAAKGSPVRVIDSQGKAQPAQVSRLQTEKDGTVGAVVSFYAALSAEGAYSYQLESGAADASGGKLIVDQQGDVLTLDNGLVALRMPKTGEFKFDKPLQFGNDHASAVKLFGRPSEQIKAGRVPGPLQGLRLNDGRWVGGSYFTTIDPINTPKVLKYTCSVVENGPLFVEARVRYEFELGCYYQMTVRMLAGDPAIRIDEQFDMKYNNPVVLYRLVTSFSDGRENGWKPDQVFYNSNFGLLPKVDPAFDQRLTDAGVDKTGTNVYSGSMPLRYGGDVETVAPISIWSHDGAMAAMYYLGLVNAADITKDKVAQGKTPFVGVVPWHAGNWRGAHGMERGTALTTFKDGSAAVAWPLTVEKYWGSANDTAEWDTKLPFSFGRRQWALVGGPLQYHNGLFPLRAQEGFVNLDDYKDWVVDWPDDPNVTYPRLVLTRADVERLKPALDNHPALKAYLYFNDTDERRNGLFQRLTQVGAPEVPLGAKNQARAGLPLGMPNYANSPWITVYRQAQMIGWVHEMDEFMSSPKTTAEQRRLLKSHVAALCNLLVEPDFNPRGSGIHLATANMPINRLLALPMAAGLIPDHPKAKQWLEISDLYTRQRLSRNIAPGGAWNELISYFRASVPTLMQSALILRNVGLSDEKTTQLAVMPAEFTMQLMTPRDPRFGIRFVPNWGHEGSDTPTHWLLAVALARESNPQLAQDLLWSWDQLGRPTIDGHDAGFSERLSALSGLLPPVKPEVPPKQLKSTWLPGFGATLRAHAGDPNETFMAYRQGYMIGHCDDNQADFVLHAKGAPLSDLSLFMYQITYGGGNAFNDIYHRVGWHNRMRFGSQDNKGGGGGLYCQVLAHALGDSTDYLRGMFDVGPVRWTRQILFLKGKTATGPNYFVFRETIPGDKKALPNAWWNLRTLGGKSQIQASEHGMNYTSQFGTKMDVHFLEPAQVQAKTDEGTVKNLLSDEISLAWRTVHKEPIERRAQGVSNPIEQTMSVTAFGPIAGGQDITLAVYPQTASEAPPKYQSLGPGVAQITTSEGTDIVFAGGQRPMEYKSQNFSFKGVAGAIRIYPQEVHLVISEGPAEITCKGITLRSSAPVTKVIPKAEFAKQQVIEVPAPKSAIEFVLDPKAGPITEVETGIRRQQLPNGYALEFNSPTALNYDTAEVRFNGNRGGLVVDNAKNTTRLVLLHSDRLDPDTILQLKLWDRVIGVGGSGPYDLTYHGDQTITGRTEGQGRILFLAYPLQANVNNFMGLMEVLIDGQSFAPGAGTDLSIPLPAGNHTIQVRPLADVPVFRNWQAWR